MPKYIAAQKQERLTTNLSPWQLSMSVFVKHDLNDLMAADGRAETSQLQPKNHILFKNCCIVLNETKNYMLISQVWENVTGGMEGERERH